MSYKVLMYKYKPLPTAEDLQYLEDSLTRRAIWLPPVPSLNDPYEGVFRFRPPTYQDLEKYDELVQLCLNLYRTEVNSSLTMEQLLNDFKQGEHINQTMSQEDKEIMKEFFQKHGVFSLTTCPSNIPMWNHYADSHKGYCLIFEVDLSIPTENYSLCEQEDVIEKIIDGKEIIIWPDRYPKSSLVSIFGKIKYVNKPGEIYLTRQFELGFNSYEGIKYAMQNSIYLKYKQWEYENEFRLVSNQNSKNSDTLMSLQYYSEFIKMKGIIVGKDLSIKNVFVDLCKRTEIDLYQANCSGEDYDMFFEKILDHGHEIGKLRSICECQCVPA